MRKKLIVLLFFLLLTTSLSVAQESILLDTVTVKAYFRQGHGTLDSLFRNNGSRLDSFARRLASFRTDTAYRIRSVRVVSGTSPEGSSKINKSLSERRGATIRSYLENGVRWVITLSRSNPGAWTGKASPGWWKHRICPTGRRYWTSSETRPSGSLATGKSSTAGKASCSVFTPERSGATWRSVSSRSCGSLACSCSSRPSR